MKPDDCVVEQVLAIIATKWTPLVVLQLRDGTRRYNEVRRGLDGISARVLTERLRMLEDLGLAERTVYPEVPVRVEYTLTEFGQRFAAILDGIETWSHDVDREGLARARAVVPPQVRRGEAAQAAGRDGPGRAGPPPPVVRGAPPQRGRGVPAQVGRGVPAQAGRGALPAQVGRGVSAQVGRGALPRRPDLAPRPVPVRPIRPAASA